MRLCCVLIWLAALPLVAADVTGKWKGEMGEGREVVFQLKSDGAKVTGTMSGAAEGEPRPITTGESKDDNISFTVASEWQGNPVKLLVSGTVSGQEMKLTVKSENGEWSTDMVAKKSD
ncbi:MAG: hypothetical protein ABI165_15720 [Bryobacteraceae bacterium]